MKKTQTSINLSTEANKVDKVIIAYITKLGIVENDFDTNFTISGKDRPDVAIKDISGKYCIIFENKKDFKSLAGAKNQGLKYLEQLKNLGKLADTVLLIRTNMSTFHADEYSILDDQIVWQSDIVDIDILDDIKIELIKRYTHPEKKEVDKLLSTDKQELKKAFDTINNFLRDKGLGKDQRLHITMAILFLKLIKENSDLLANIEEGDNKKDLLDELGNIKVNITERNIIKVFEAVNKVYNKEFHFDLEQYKNKEILSGLFDIIDQVNLSNYDLDIKGEAFEYFINYGNTSSDMGEYFTPRHIVRFMVRLIDETLQYHREKLSSKTFFDPTCGTGGFLIEIFKEIKEELKRTNTFDEAHEEKLRKTTIYGNELNLRSSEIAKMNMILTGDGHSNIHQGDFVEVKEQRIGAYDITIGNPPFGNNREWEFIDGFLKCVNVGGFSMILVPEGVLFKADKNFVEIRRTLLNKGKLLKVISLPQGAFLPYAGVKTNIIFWKNEIQYEDYDIEFIDIKNDGFSLDANRRPLKNSDLLDYFTDKQSLIERGQIWTVKSSAIYDKTRLNELELERSRLELEEKDLKKKLDTLKKQLKTIDDRGEKELKEKRIGEVQLVLDTLKKQLKKTNDKLKNFDINLVVNRYRPKNEIYTDIHYELFGDLVEYLPKSKRNASEGKDTGKYPFFTSSEIQSKWIDECDYREESLIIGTGGKAAIHISQEFCTSTDNFIISVEKTKVLTKYLHFLLKYNLSILEAGFKGAGIKHISKDYINNIRIPLPSLEYQTEIVRQIEEYEKIVVGAKQVVDTYTPEIEIQEEWEMVELGDYIEVISGFAFESKDFTDSGVQVIKIGNVKDRFFDKRNIPSYLPIEFKDLYKDYLLKSSDILISMTGTVGKTDYGNVCQVDEGDYLLNQRVAKLQVSSHTLDNNFLYYSCLQKSFKNQLFTFSTGGIRQANISSSQLKQIEIPLPPLPEQERIVAELEREQSLVNANKELIEIYDTKIRRIIEKVWRGE